MTRVVVVGYGMVAHRFVTALGDGFEVVVFAEEPRPAYDRVHLTSLFEGASPEDLALDPVAPAGVDVRVGRRIESLDLDRRVVVDDLGGELVYDELVLATGSVPFVPPIPGADHRGVFVYRTVEDVTALQEWSAGRTTGVVIGGGLLGLEAAAALANLGLDTTVVDLAPRLMSVQLDDGGAAALRRRIEARGLGVRLGVAPVGFDATPEGIVESLRLADGTVVKAEVVVVAAGIRPRDQLARTAGLTVGERGGIAIDDTGATSEPHVWAIGEVALHRGRVYGLVAPGYRMAEVVAARLRGEAATFEGAELAAKLKLLGVDVATVGCGSDAPADALDVVLADPVSSIYRRLIVSADGSQLLGAVLVGDISGYAILQATAAGSLPFDGDALALLAPVGAAKPASGGLLALPASAPICSCNAVCQGDLVAAIEGGAATVGALKACTRAGTTCGSCVALLDQLLGEVARAAGQTVRKTICEHFDHTRAELFDLVRVNGIRSFAVLLSAHGRGRRGCEICKPAVASMLASLGTGHILDGEQATLQDTNDFVLANIQRDGTYSVVPRVPAGEITPAQLQAIGSVAADFDLYTKITGAQRIDLFGARIDELPLIWARLVDAGFESGHAYGKALRAVKSCVGSTWCRYGVQDSVGFAIRVEHRYKGLRAPHKLKMAVSGCARECAEAQGKDVGFIATENGYDVYVCGNGGMRPRHAELLASGVDEDTAIRLTDRFLAYYIRTADRLQRTAPWFDQRFATEGGIEALRAIVVEDSLGLAAELDALIEHHVDTYRCEWAETLADPVRLARFEPFINDPGPDSSLVFIRERGQRIPASTGRRS